MGNLSRLFDASTIGDSLATSFKPSGRNLASGGMLGGLVDNPRKIASDIKSRPQRVIPMMDPEAIAAQQRKNAARQAAGGGGRSATVLTGGGADTSDRLGP